MILTLNITEDSKVELIKDNCEAVQGEHNVTVLNINFPTTIKGYSIDNYAKQIEFAECKELGECVKFMDVLEGNTYKLCSTCTQFEKLMIQFTLKNLVDEAEPIVWKTIPFMLEFCESINAENNKEVQVTLLSLAEIKAEWAKDLTTTKNEWEAFIKANAMRMVYKVGDVPTPDATSLGDTIFYLGANSTEPYTLTYGHYYRCNLANGVYEWTDLTRDPNLADVANGIREINNNQSMQLWVGTKEELANEVPQPNVVYVPSDLEIAEAQEEIFEEMKDDNGVLKADNYIIPLKKTLWKQEAPYKMLVSSTQNNVFSEICSFSGDFKNKTICVDCGGIVLRKAHLGQIVGIGGSIVESSINYDYLGDGTTTFKFEYSSETDTTIVSYNLYSDENIWQPLYEIYETIE